MLRQLIMICNVCGKDFISVSGNPLDVCRDCFNSYHRCSECGTMDMLGIMVKNIQGKKEWRCRPCFRNKPIFKCVSCYYYFDYHPVYNAVLPNGGTYCSDCYATKFLMFDDPCYLCSGAMNCLENYVIKDGKYMHLECFLKRSEILFRKF